MKVSLVITCFNRAKTVARAIRSATAQSFPKDEMEIVVVDDGSSDASVDIIRDFGDRVSAVFLPENGGLPAARNVGIRRALGRFVMHLDSDDYLHEEAVNILYWHLASNPDWGAVACDYVVVNDHEIHVRRGRAEDEPIACGIMFRKDALIDIGLYDEDMRLLEDREFRQRFQAKYRIDYCRVPLYRYVRHEGNLTNDASAIAHYEGVLARKQATKAKNRRGE